MPATVKNPRRVLAGTIGAHESWAKTEDRPARTAAARRAMEQKFLDEAAGDPVRAEHLRKAYFARLALKSAQVRRKNPPQADKLDAFVRDVFGDELADDLLTPGGAR